MDSNSLRNVSGSGQNDYRHSWQIDEKTDEFDGKERADYGPGIIFFNRIEDP